MLRFLADENFNGDITRGLLLRDPDTDLIRVQDVGSKEVDDPPVFEWAAVHNRIVLTHDQATMPDFAHDRIIVGQQMPGVFVLNNRTPIQQAIEELLLVDECSDQEEWSNLVVYLPL